MDQGKATRNVGGGDGDIEVVFEPDLKEHKEQALGISERSIPSQETKWRGLRHQCVWRVKDNPGGELGQSRGRQETRSERDWVQIGRVL